MPTKQDITDWVLGWDVKVILSEENATLLDMMITVDTPKWVEVDESDEAEEVLEITMNVGAPAVLWESLSEAEKEDSRNVFRRKTYEEVILPHWLEYLNENEM